VRWLAHILICAKTSRMILSGLARRVRPMDDFWTCAPLPDINVFLSMVTGRNFIFEVPGAYPMMLVSLRGKELIPSLEQSNGASEEILSVITEFSQSIAANLELKIIVQSILDNVSRLVSSDMLELNLWNEENQVLIPYHFQPSDLSFSSVTRVAASQFGTLTQQLVARRTPIMIADARSQPELAPNGELLPVQSYLGIPLMAGENWSAPWKQVKQEMVHLVSMTLTYYFWFQVRRLWQFAMPGL